MSNVDLPQVLLRSKGGHRAGFDVDSLTVYAPNKRPLWDVHVRPHGNDVYHVSARASCGGGEWDRVIGAHTLFFFARRVVEARTAREQENASR